LTQVQSPKLKVTKIPILKVPMISKIFKHQTFLWISLMAIFHINAKRFQIEIIQKTNSDSEWTSRCILSLNDF
jgi:hypothetical protein